MVHNWKYEGVIEEMRVIKPPSTPAFFVENVFCLSGGWMIVHRVGGFSGSELALANLVEPL